MLTTAFILAAGLGSRLRPLTQQSAKPCLYLNGQRLIERHLFDLQQAGFKRVVINCCWEGQQLRQLLGDGTRFGLQLLYSVEDQAPLETASGLARAAPLIGDAAFALVNGDVWCDFDFTALHTLQAPTIVLTDNPPHNPEGDFALDQGRAINGGHDRLTYCGIAVLSSNFVKASAGSGEKLGDFLRASARLRELNALRHRGMWHDIGTPSALWNVQH